jgi:hypothetical protein
MYRRMPCWADRTIGYFMFHINVVQMPYYSECFFFRETQLFPIDVDDCAIKQCGTLNEFRSHCEVKSKASRAAGKELPVMIALHRDVTLETNITVTLIPCPSSNHLTHVFLACDPDTQCGSGRYTPLCPITGNVTASQSRLFYFSYFFAGF